MAIDKDLLDWLLEGRDPSELFVRDGLLDDLKKALSERILERRAGRAPGGGARRDAGAPPAEPAQRDVAQDGADGHVRGDARHPQDRAGTFDPQLIAKYQRRFPDFDDKIVSMHARGMSTRAIRDHLEELYGIEVSPDLISAVTDAVIEEVAEWQGRPLDACYPLVVFDAIRVKIRAEGFVRNKAVYLALGLQPDGTKEILRLWIEQSGRDQTTVRGTVVPDHGAKFWLRVMNEFKTCGVADVLIAVVDRLKGFPEAITAVRRANTPPDCLPTLLTPDTVVQTCIVNLIRHALEFVSWQDRKAVVSELRRIYRAADAKAGLAALDAFEAGPWGQKYPAIAMSWRRNWAFVVPFFAFPEAVRRIVYTTDDIDKTFVPRCATLLLCGRPRGEERRVGWKRRRAAHPIPAEVRRPHPRPAP